MRFSGSASTSRFLSLRIGIIPVLLTFVLFASPLSATTIVVPDDEELIRKSEIILSGTVVRSQSVDANGELQTETQVRVDRILKGSVEETVVIRHAGGRNADRARVIFGTPEYETGERVLLFLNPADDGVFETSDLSIGKFSERRTSTGSRVWFRSNDPAGTTLLDGSFKKMQAKGDPQRLADEFETWVRERLSGRSPESDYFVHNPQFPRRESALFATLAESEIHRWFRFDDGGQVAWHSVGGQAGFENSGIPELQAALKVWSSFDGARVRYSYGGSVPATAAATTANGVNEILFNDPYAEIFGRWNGQSGVLAQAEYHVRKVNRSWTAPFDAAPGHPAKTYPEVWEIVEGNIVIQEGVSPFYRVGDVMLTQIIAHELGHTLGLAHSHDSAALMSSTIDGSGAFLRADDKLAVSWLYPNGAGAPRPPSTSAPELTPVSVDFSMSTEFAGVDEPLQLVDRTTGAPLSWEWSFGDGSTSTERNPSHEYASPGTYLVTLSASNGVFTSSRSRSVVVTPEPLVHSLIPVASATSGAAGTSWRSELSLFNSGDAPADLTLVYLSSDGADRLTRSITLDAGEAVAFDNALLELFGIDSGTGAIEVSSIASIDPESIRVASRTFTGGEAGTYGQSVPQLSSPGSVTYIAGIKSEASFRTNIGLVNRSLNEVNAVLVLMSETGEVLGRRPILVQGRSFQQQALINLFPDFSGSSGSALSMRIEAERDHALTAYASVVDNRSQDPMLIPGKAPAGPETLIPGVARTQGAGGTFWVTDVTLHNPTAVAMDVELRLLGTPEGRRVSLEAHSTLSVTNVVEWLGVDATQGALEVYASGATGPVLSAQTYTTRIADRATFGQSVTEAARDAWATEPSVTGLRSNGRYRTNAGLVNPSESSADVEVSLLVNGEKIDRIVRLEPRSQAQLPLSTLFPGIQFENTATLTARSLNEIPILLYASVVDNQSGDPTFLAGR